MLNVVVFHSSRKGTGRTTIVANVAAMLAAGGKRVGIVDAGEQSASMALLSGLPSTAITHTFNDYLAGQCESVQVMHDVTPLPLARESSSGQVFLLPAGQPWELHEQHPIQLLVGGLERITNEFALDLILVDTHALIGDEALTSLLSVAISSTLVIVLCLNQKSYQGTGVMVDIARALEVPRIALIANLVAAAFDRENVRAQLYETYQCDVAAVLPYTEEIMLTGGTDLFVLRYADHPVCRVFRNLAEWLATPAPANTKTDARGG